MMDIKPSQVDVLHNALHFLGNSIIDRKMSAQDIEELGCLLLILADYSYFAYRTTE